MNGCGRGHFVKLRTDGQTRLAHDDEGCAAPGHHPLIGTSGS